MARKRQYGYRRKGPAPKCGAETGKGPCIRPPGHEGCHLQPPSDSPSRHERNLQRRLDDPDFASEYERVLERVAQLERKVEDLEKGRGCIW